jgi:hypothetical protein
MNVELLYEADKKGQIYGRSSRPIRLLGLDGLGVFSRHKVSVNLLVMNLNVLRTNEQCSSACLVLQVIVKILIFDVNFE